MATLELDIEKIRLLSKQRRDANYNFRSFLKGQNSEKLDKIVQRLYTEISEQINCMDCGNCCNQLRPDVTNAEISVLAKHDQLSQADFVAQFVANDEFNQSNYLKNTPCKYLEGRECKIYSIRPQDCISYPHLHKKGFNSRTMGVIENYGICPIVFNVFERLKSEFHFRNR